MRRVTPEQQSESGDILAGQELILEELSRKIRHSQEFRKVYRRTYIYAIRRLSKKMRYFVLLVGKAMKLNAVCDWLAKVHQGRDQHVD